MGEPHPLNSVPGIRDGAEGCHFYTTCCRGEKGGKKIPRTRAHLLRNLPWVGEHKWNWPLWCFHMRMLRSCQLRGVLSCGVVILWLQWSEDRREAVCGREVIFVCLRGVVGAVDQFLTLIRASVPRACLFPASSACVGVIKSLLPSPQALPCSG